MSVLSSYFVPVIMGLCFCIGYVIKKSFHFIPNQYIPAILMATGALIAVISNLQTGVTPRVILEGMASGLASTGLHQAFIKCMKETYKDEQDQSK